MCFKLVFFFSLLIYLSSFLQSIYAQRSQTLPKSVGREESAPIFADSEPNDNESNDLLLIPGVTQSIIINFKGNTEDITFDFQSPKDQSSSLYKVSTYFNNRLESSNYYNFSQSEILNININYQAGQCSIVGNNGFTMSIPINDNSYYVTTTQQRVPEILQTQLSGSGSSNFFSWLQIAGGTCGLVMFGVTLLFLIKNKNKKEFHDERLPDKSVKESDPTNKLETEPVYTSRVLMQKMKEEDQVQTCQTYPESESPLEVTKTMLDFKGKPENYKSQTMLTSTLTMTSTHHSYKASSMSNFKLLTEENLCSEEGDIRRELENDSKVRSLPSIPSDSSLQKALQNDPHEGLALEMDFEIKQGTRRMPTVKEIRDMARRMEEEGLVGSECNLSDDSDDEDQYEAPILPNYFCCMICFEGTRCTIVDPCRHIFACVKCVEDLLDSYKICVLCSRDIISYEPLEPTEKIHD